MLSLLVAGAAPIDNPECPQASACDFGNSAMRSLRRADADLKGAEGQLLGTLHDKRVVDDLDLEVETVMAIEELVRTWRPGMEAECGVFGAVTGGASPWKSAWKVACEADKARDRARVLLSVTACLRKRRSDESDPSACLYPLTPSLPATYYQGAD
ncbi:hypothetical protein GCM10009087_52660 [Sphingomonas oligophenolica]